MCIDKLKLTIAIYVLLCQDFYNYIKLNGIFSIYSWSGFLRKESESSEAISFDMSSTYTQYRGQKIAINQIKLHPWHQDYIIFILPFVIINSAAVLFFIISIIFFMEFISFICIYIYIYIYISDNFMLLIFFFICGWIIYVRFVLVRALMQVKG